MHWPKIIFWLLCATLLLPVAYLLFGIFAAVNPEDWQHVREFLLLPALRDSAIVVIAVALLTLILGIPAAWCVTYFQFRGRRLLSILLVLPLAVPSYVAAYISTDAREALIPWLVNIRRTEGAETYLMVEMLLRYIWLCTMLAAVLYPYIFLAARASFASSGHKMSEASRLLGHSAWRTFFSINLPLAKPAIITGLFLVAMETLNDYGAVQHFGIQTLTPTLFRIWFDMDDLENARRLAGFVLIAILAFKFIEHQLRGKARFDQKRAASKPLKKPSRLALIACWLCCLLPICIGMIYPCFTLLHWLKNSTAPIEITAFIRASQHTLLLSLFVTITCVVVALLLIGILRFFPSELRANFLRALGIAGYASPGAVLAIAIFTISASAQGIFFSNNSSEWVPKFLMSGSLLWLGYGLVVRYFTIAGQNFQASMLSLPKGLDESARLLGHSPLRTFLSIHTPLLRPAIAAAGIIIFIDVIKELPLTLILRPFDFETLGTWTYSMANQGNIFACAAPSLAIIGIGSLGLIIVELFIWKRL